MAFAFSAFRPSAEFRTRLGKAVHTAGIAGAMCLLGRGAWLAFLWQDKYGAFALLSSFCYATTIYLIGRLLRWIIGRQHRDSVGGNLIEWRQ